MARYGVNIEKAMTFRGALQHFGNTYYYEAPVPSTQLSTLEGLVDQLVAIEKPFHSTNVTFVRGRLWSADGTKAENQMIIDKALSGAGTGGAANANQDRERAYLLQFRAGIDSRGRPVYLRKWFHVQGSMGGVTPTANQLCNLDPLTTGQRNGLVAIGEQLKTIPYTVGSNWDLRSKTGRAITGATSAHPWLEHRQLGDEWRGS